LTGRGKYSLIGIGKCVRVVFFMKIIIDFEEIDFIDIQSVFLFGGESQELFNPAGAFLIKDKAIMAQASRT